MQTGISLPPIRADALVALLAVIQRQFPIKFRESREKIQRKVRFWPGIASVGLTLFVVFVLSSSGGLPEQRQLRSVASISAASRIPCDGPSPLLVSDPALRACTAACGQVMSQLLPAPENDRDCTASELLDALHNASRPGGTDAPLIVPTCRLHWYMGESACRVLDDAGGLDFRGDSIARHISQAMRELLIGDLAEGTNAHVKQTWAQLGLGASGGCSCDWAYYDAHSGRFPARPEVDSLCRQESVARLNLSALRAVWPSYCRSWGHTERMLPFDCPFNGLYEEGVHRGDARFVIMQGGLHFPFGIGPAAADEYFSVRRLKANASHFLYLGLPYPGQHRPAQYRSAEALVNTVKMNQGIEWMAALARSYDRDARYVPLLPLTANATSLDGKHFLHATNVVIAQLLFNVIAAINREPEGDGSSGAVTAAAAASSGAEGAAPAAAANLTLDGGGGNGNIDAVL
jgi:hypothetical protein